MMTIRWTLVYYDRRHKRNVKLEVDSPTRAGAIPAGRRRLRVLFPSGYRPIDFELLDVSTG
jgi:hypothetical protein